MKGEHNMNQQHIRTITNSIYINVKNLNNNVLCLSTTTPLSFNYHTSHILQHASFSFQVCVGVSVLFVGFVRVCVVCVLCVGTECVCCLCVCLRFTRVCWSACFTENKKIYTTGKKVKKKVNSLLQ